MEEAGRYNFFLEKYGQKNKLKILFEGIKLLAEIKSGQKNFNNFFDLGVLQKMRNLFEKLGKLRKLTSLEDKCQKEILDNIEKIERGDNGSLLQIINEKPMSIDSFFYQEEQQKENNIYKGDADFRKQLLILSGLFLFSFVIT